MLNFSNYLQCFVLIVFVGLLGFAPELALAVGNDSDWQDKMNNGMQKFRESNYAQAEPLLKAAYRQVQDLPAQDLKKINSEIALADLYRATKRYTEAEALYKSALTALDSPKSQMALVMILNKIAGLEKDKGDFSQADNFYKRSLQIIEQQKGKEDIDIATVLSNMSLLYQSQGHLSEAEQLQEQAVKILSGKTERPALDYAQALYDLASLKMLQGKAKAAIPNFEESLTQLQKTLPANDLRIACGFDGLGTAYFSEKRYKEAEQLARKALSIYEQKPDKASVEIAVSLSNLGYRLLRQNKLDEAELCFQRSIKIQEKQFGTLSFETVANRQGLAEIYAQRQNYKKTESILRTILAIKQKQYGANHIALSSTLTNLANCISIQGQRSTEVDDFLDQVKAAKKSVPEKHLRKVNELLNGDLIKELDRSAKRYKKKDDIW